MTPKMRVCGVYMDVWGMPSFNLKINPKLTNQNIGGKVRLNDHRNSIIFWFHSK